MATSEKIMIARGVQQGCPLSPLLFDLAIEMLAIAVRADKKVQGIVDLKD